MALSGPELVLKMVLHGIVWILLCITMTVHMNTKPFYYWVAESVAIYFVVSSGLRTYDLWKIYKSLKEASEELNRS